MSNRHVCDRQVKKLVCSFHKSCTKKEARKSTIQVSGKYLNHWLANYRGIISNPFINSHKLNYNICSNLHLSIKNDLSTIPIAVVVSKQPTKKKKEGRSNNKENSATFQDLRSREERRFMRNRIPVKSLKGIDKVKIEIGDDDTYYVDVKDKKEGMSYNDVFKEDILKHYYKVRFGELTMRNRRVRMREIAKHIFGATIDRKQFNKSDSNLEYLHFNQSLAVDILNLLDGVKEFIEKKMKIDFDVIRDEAVRPLESDIEGGLINELNDKNKYHKLAILLLSEMTGRGYERSRSNLIAATGGNNRSELSQIPSLYMIKKKRPAIIPLNVKKMINVDDDSTSNEQGNILLLSVDSTDCGIENTTAMKLENISVNNYSEEEELERVRRIASEAGDVMEGAIIKGGYGMYMKLMEDKHGNKGRIMGRGDEMIVLDSIDGAEHLKSKKSVTSIISFSSSHFCSSWIQEGSVTAGSSLNILTWQQLRGTESLHTMMPAVKDYFSEKKVLRDLLVNDPSETLLQGGKYWFYDLHDGKMLYLLCQHSLWNRKYNPFLLCTCQRGEGVRSNDNHVCRMVGAAEHVELYKKSAEKWKDRREHAKISRKEYNYKMHCNWADRKNKGCTHFGVSPDLLPRDGIRFDTFHLKCAVSRKLMNYLRNFLLHQGSDVTDEFISKILKKFYNDYHIYVWKNKKNFASFLGNEIALFVSHIEHINAFLKNNLLATPTLIDLTDALSVWVELFKFLAISHLRDRTEEQYVEQILFFEKNLKKFYDAGSRTFLTTGAEVGKEETFYLHALRYYMPEVVRTTYDRHKLGVGIFSMQGFERRNKESKHCMRNCSSNNKGNSVMNNLGRIYDVFMHETNENK
jgi:hypothetical protein